MKKPFSTPDVNANAPRPRHISSDDADIPTIDSPPGAVSETETGFDRAIDATDQEHRAGLLPGSDDDMAPEYPENPEDDFDVAEGVDPGPYKEFWAERQSFPQQDDPDLEGAWEDEDSLLDDEEPGVANDEPPSEDARKGRDVT